MKKKTQHYIQVNCLMLKVRSLIEEDGVSSLFSEHKTLSLFGQFRLRSRAACYAKLKTSFNKT